MDHQYLHLAEAFAESRPRFIPSAADGNPYNTGLVNQWQQDRDIVGGALVDADPHFKLIPWLALTEPKAPAEDDIARRQRIEREIVTTAVESLLAADYMISVNDGEDTVLLNSQDQTAIIDAMFSTDQDVLFVRPRNRRISTPLAEIRSASAMIHFVYGNDGHDVIADNSVSIEPLLAAATALAEKYANED